MVVKGKDKIRFYKASEEVSTIQARDEEQEEDIEVEKIDVKLIEQPSINGELIKGLNE